MIYPACWHSGAIGRGTRYRRLMMRFSLITQLAVVAAAHGQFVGWWRFEEGTPGAGVPESLVMWDSVLGNHGTPFGLPVSSSPLDSCAGMGLHYDGVDNRVFCPDRAEYANLASMTVEVVLSTPGYFPSCCGFNQLVFRGDDRAGSDPFFLTLQSDGRVGYYINNALVVQSPSPLPSNRPISVAATLDGATGTARMFVNRVQIAVASTTLRPTAVLTGPLPGLGFGNVQSPNFRQFFVGTIYEVRIANRALVPAEMLPAPIAVTSQPGDRQACRGTTASFSVATSGDTPSSYAWQWKPPGQAENWMILSNGVVPGLGTVAGATTLQVTVSDTLAEASGGEMRCIVIGGCGGKISLPGTLTVCACLGCSADFNEDGGIDGSDIQAFFVAWEAGLCDADVNADGGVDGADAESFFGVWQAGGC